MHPSIRPVTLDDVVGLERYEAIRDEVRRRVIALKKARRVAVGPELTFVFENHDTVYFQIQEMLRAERITDLDAVRAELAVYNALLPAPGELSATLLIEITDQQDVAARLLQFLGIDECVALMIGDRRVPGEFEAGRSREDKLSAVQYVRFALPPAARAAFADPSEPVRLVVDHPRYRYEAAIAGAVRASLAADLQGAA
ncbi:DUF3501 family protein [bacterium]|nr:DUF3501 family protein [bacterium]